MTAGWPAPQALLFDLDGVLADVRESYRRAVVETAAQLGVVLTPPEIAAAKAEGDANNDWVLTRRLLARHGVEADLDEVTRRFEALYQGGLWEAERLLCPVAVVARLARRLPLGVVTGRPRRDAERFLEHFGLAEHFVGMVCMGEAPAKPDPAPVRLCLEHLGVVRAWMLGDTPDDVRAALGAGVLPLGVVAPGEDSADALRAAGAVRVIVPTDLEELLP